MSTRRVHVPLMPDHFRELPRRISTLPRRFDADRPTPATRRPPARTSEPAAAPNVAVEGPGLTFAELVEAVDAARDAGAAPDTPLTGVVAEDGRVLNLRIHAKPADEPAPVAPPLLAAPAVPADEAPPELRELAAKLEAERKARVASKRPGPTRW